MQKCAKYQQTDQIKSINIQEKNHMQEFKRRHHSINALGKKQDGASLLEMLFYAGLVITLAVFVTPYLTDVTASTKQSRGETEISNTIALVESWRGSKSRKQDTTGLSITQMKTDGVQLSKFTTGEGENVYGLDIKVETASAGSDWKFTYETGDQPSCTFHLDSLGTGSQFQVAPACAAGTLTATFN